jgi:hypothetical protein
MSAEQASVVSPPPLQFLGIDLAGDSGTTGVALITAGAGGLRYSFPQGRWKGGKGLLRLKGLVLGAEGTALDQPFAYPAGTMRLLTDLPLARGDEDASAYCSRRTDTAMRGILDTVGLAADYVMSPNRCQNVWRALALARLCNLSRREVCLCASRLVETHPRVAWTMVLADWAGSANVRRFVETYKGESWSETQRTDSRKAMLALFEEGTGVRPSGEKPQEQQEARAEAWDSVDSFEALICAYVAFLRSRGATTLAGFPHPDQEQELLALEGAAVLPPANG